MKIGRWTLVAELGKGGFGSVWRAQDERGGQVALKLFHAAGLDPAQVARFVRESQALSRVRDDGLVGLIEAGHQDGQLWLALELVEGETLEQRLRVRGRLAVREALSTAGHLARTLSRLHAAGVIHRDLKPANVIIRPDGLPVLVDLGLALLLQVDARLTRSGEILGTPGWLAPELASGDGRAGGPAVDVYGLGATLYGLLVGRPPFEGPTPMACLARVLSEPAPAPSAAREELPPELDRLCARCLAKRPEERFPSAGALALELERMLVADSLAPARRSPRLAYAAAIALLASGAGVATWLSVSRASSEPTRAGPTVEERLARAVELDLQRRPAEAFEQVAAAIQADPRSAEAWARRAVMRATGSEPADRNARLEAARSDARRALELDPDCALALAARGMCEERPELSGPDLDRAVDLAPDDAELLGYRAAWRRARGNSKGARKDIDLAIQLQPKVARHYSIRALLDMSTTGGLEDMDRAVALDPNDPYLRGLRGRALIHLERYHEAVAELDRAIQLAGDEPDASWFFDRGIARFGLGELREGIADETRALELAPTQRYSQAFRGRMHLAAGDVELARKDYDVAVADRPPALFAEARLAIELAEAYLRRRDLEEAERFANTVLGTDSDPARQLHGRAQKVLTACGVR